MYTMLPGMFTYPIDAQESLRRSLHVVMDNVSRDRGTLFTMGKYHKGLPFGALQAFGFFLSFVFLVSFCTNTTCSASSQWNGRCRQARVRTSSPKVSDHVQQAATTLINLYVSGLKQVFGSIISLSGMRFYKFCRLSTCRYHNVQVSHAYCLSF